MFEGDSAEMGQGFRIFSQVPEDQCCRLVLPDAFPNRLQIQASAADRTCLVVRQHCGTLELCLSHRNFADPRPSALSLPAPILVANLPFAGSYGHVLNDVLPRLLAMDADPAIGTVLTAHAPLLRDLIKLLDLRLPKVRLVDDEPLYLDPTAVILENHQPYCRRDLGLTRAFKAVVETCLQRRHPELAADTLIYYSRSASHNVYNQRAMEPANEAAIVELLAAHAEAHGLRLVIFNGIENGVTMPLHRQVALFRSARMVVGPHGGGMANLIWLNPQVHCLVCEFTSGTQKNVWGRFPFSKNFNTLYGGLIGSFSRYALIPFTPESSVDRTLIDLRDLQAFLDWAGPTPPVSPS